MCFTNQVSFGFSKHSVCSMNYFYLILMWYLSKSFNNCILNNILRRNEFIQHWKDTRMSKQHYHFIFLVHCPFYVCIYYVLFKLSSNSCSCTKIQDSFCYCLLSEQQEWAQEGFTTTKKYITERKQGADCVSDLPFCSTSILSVGRENKGVQGEKEIKMN